MNTSADSWVVFHAKGATEQRTQRAGAAHRSDGRGRPSPHVRCFCQAVVAVDCSLGTSLGINAAKKPHRYIIAMIANAGASPMWWATYPTGMPVISCSEVPAK